MSRFDLDFWTVSFRSIYGVALDCTHKRRACLLASSHLSVHWVKWESLLDCRFWKVRKNCQTTPPPQKKKSKRCWKWGFYFEAPFFSLPFFSSDPLTPPRPVFPAPLSLIINPDSPIVVQLLGTSCAIIID